MRNHNRSLLINSSARSSGSFSDFDVNLSTGLFSAALNESLSLIFRRLTMNIDYTFIDSRNSQLIFSDSVTGSSVASIQHGTWSALELQIKVESALNTAAAAAGSAAHFSVFYLDHLHKFQYQVSSTVNTITLAFDSPYDVQGTKRVLGFNATKVFAPGNYTQDSDAPVWLGNEQTICLHCSHAKSVLLRGGANQLATDVLITMPVINVAPFDLYSFEQELSDQYRIDWPNGKPGNVTLHFSIRDVKGNMLALKSDVDLVFEIDQSV